MAQLKDNLVITANYNRYERFLMNNTERLLNALTHKYCDRVPAVGMLTSVTTELMELCGVNYLTAHTNACDMVTLAAAAFEYSGLESIKLPFDMTVEAEAFGCEIDYGSKITLPQVRSHVYNNPNELLVDRSFLDRSRIPVVLKAIDISRKRYNDALPVISSIVGPFTLATRLYGMESILEYTITEPDTLKVILEKTTEISIIYSTEQVNAGAHVIVVGEAACSGELISPQAYKQFFAPAHKRLCTAIPIPSIVHICGNITGHLDYIFDTGMTGISFDDQTDINKAVRLLKGKTALIGYVNTLKILCGGDADLVERMSVECIKNGIDVLCAGCAWPPEVPLENIKAMVRASKRA